MVTALEIKNEVVAILTSPDTVSPTDAAAAAEAYASLCRRANDRLRRCADYLRRSLYAEAIHHAELRPDVLDLFGSLDLPQFEDWQAMCRQNGWEVPQRLIADAAQELNAAYNIYRPMEDLLKKHRLLALAKAPLPQRLTVLRSLAEMGPADPVWEDDIKALEAARLKEIALEAKTAAEAKDQRTLRSCLDELRAPGWRIEVPKTHIDAIRKVLRSFQVKDAMSELKDLLGKLEQAYMAMSCEECEPLALEWAQLVADHKISVPGEMQERVQPIFDWLAAQRAARESQAAFAQACADLERALDVKAPTDELRRFHSAVRAFDQPLPAELHRRYETETASRDLARRRKTHLILGFAGAGTLAVAIAVVLLVQSGLQRSQAQQWSQQIRAAIDKGELDRASSMWETLQRDNTKLLQRAELVDARTRLDAAVAKQEADSKQFRVILDEIKPDELTKNPGKEAFAKVRARLTDAEKLARTPRQQLEVTNRRDEINKIEAKWQKTSDDALQADIDKLQKSFDALPASALDRSLDDYATRLEALRKELGDIPPRHPNAGTLVLGMLNPLKERLKGMEEALRRAREAAQRSNRKQEMLSSLVGAVASAQRLAERLNEFAKEFPDDPRAAGFRKAAANQAVWTAIQDYHRLVNPWGSSLEPKDLRELERRLETIKTYLDQHPIAFNPQVLANYQAYLALAQQALQPDGPWKGELQKMVNGPLMRNLQHIKTTDGKVYYIPADTKPFQSSAGLQITILTSTDMSTRKKIIQNPAFRTPRPAPHVDLAEQIDKRLQALSLSNWDACGLELIRLIQKQTDVDPVLKLALVGNVLERHLKLCWWIDPSKRTASDEFQKLMAAVNAVNWVDAEDEEVQQARNVAKQELAGVAKNLDPDQVLAGLVKLRQSLGEGLKSSVAGYGLAMRGQSGWTVLAATGVLKEGCRFSVLGPPAEDKSQTLREIGAVKSGKAVVANEKMDQIPEGSLVFIGER